MKKGKKANCLYRLHSSFFLIVLAFIVVLTWFVPVSTVTVNDAGEQVVHYNTMTGENGELIKNAGTQPAGIWDLFLAPIKGFQSGADVNFSILISGAFLAIINATGRLTQESAHC